MTEGEKKKGCKKAGRKKAAAAAYAASMRREFNKARRLKRHLKKHPARQPYAWKALELLGKDLSLKQKQELGFNDFMKGRQ